MFSTTFRTTRYALPFATRAFSVTSRASLARMSIVGRLGVTPEEVTTANDKSLVRFVVGSSYGKGDDRKTSWFRVASFVQGMQKEFLMSIPKGSLIYIDADARMESYTDNEGNKRSNLSLIARSPGNFDVISRPRVQEEGVETNEEGLVQEAHA
ncbi:ssDNA binding protein-like protein [Lindgomyces ingoldianus]|uniref:SsDNA binding protein-like protein n=1 Tax=Lindgomyces ingoldianus TaxID=673940 RepID=A0ACB6R7D8_9PLEO|nr:ssDNA binding protein-like protein [Lindgomyces ingoldianus]KAF2474232.1 ssDNA binding protein-like protein [Lindgomyces ingoldianus]